MNLTAPAYFAGDRSFMNLLAGSRWVLVSPANVWGDMPADRLNNDHDIILIKTGESVARTLQTPLAAREGQSVQIKCRWKGQGSVSLSPWVAKNVQSSGNALTFTWVPDGILQPILFISKTTPSDPVRKIDCRETSADPDRLFMPEYIAQVARYRAVRFMDWQNTNANLPVTWATRTTPSSGEVTGDDGIAVEYMVALANQARVDPWFSMPWNADADYVRRFAQYVRDNLSPDLKAYVEVSNEVWNWGFKVTHQADAEGKAKGLSQTTGVAMYMRYAEKTIEDMDIWSDVFKGQTNRIVRVAATQNALTVLSGQIFSFRDLPDHVDALATAPYFYVDNEPTIATNLDDFFANVLPARINFVFGLADVHKAVANKYGKRFITYEAGQHLVTQDLTLARKIQTDPRMGQIMTKYLQAWDQRYGDLITLYQEVGPISQYGAWGMQEFAGQPASEAPKYAAVMNFLNSIGQ
ncbi:hypothetical protein [Sphingobium sp. CR28]|uniref:hypothetical protein n=1 Tax=Sphingobium sp. CR28 TaxID=3400272 RepID=UPI003FED8F85